MSKYPFPEWYRKIFPPLDVASKLGLSALITALTYRSLQKSQKPEYRFVPTPVFVPTSKDRKKKSDIFLSKIAAETFLQKVLPETVALAIGVGAADVGSNLLLDYLRKRKERKEQIKSRAIKQPAFIRVPKMVRQNSID